MASLLLQIFCLISLLPFLVLKSGCSLKNLSCLMSSLYHDDELFSVGSVLRKPTDLSFFCLFFFRLGAVMCMGVTAGAYILTLFAVSCTPWYHQHDYLFIYFRGYPIGLLRSGDLLVFSIHW